MGALSLLVAACSTQPPARTRAALPSYGPEDALTLDDSFSGHLFETAFVPGEAGDEAHFNERAAAAESIWLLKVATVSKEGSLGNKRRYSVSFRTLETLAGPAPKAPIELTISARDPAFHWLDRVGGAWVGREVLFMVRTFRAGAGEVLHFHGEPNSPELRTKIMDSRRRASARERAARPVQK